MEVDWRVHACLYAWGGVWCLYRDGMGKSVRAMTDDDACIERRGEASGASYCVWSASCIDSCTGISQA